MYSVVFYENCCNALNEDFARINILIGTIYIIYSN